MLVCVCVCINENILKDLSVAAEYGGRDKIAAVILFKWELQIYFLQVKGLIFFISVEQTKLLLQMPSIERYYASSIITIVEFLQT